MQMLIGAAMMGGASIFLDGTVVPMLGAIAACALLAFGFSRMIPRQTMVA